MDAARSARHLPASAVASLYGYAGAAVGLWLFASAGVQIVAAVAMLALDVRLDSTSPNPVPSLVAGLLHAALGGSVAWWHLRYAMTQRRSGREQALSRGALYFHVVALVALVAALIGSVELMSSAVDLVAPECIAPGTTDYVPGRSCLPPRAVAVRNAVEGAVLLVVASPLFVWHVRKGRQTAIDG